MKEASKAGRVELKAKKIEPEQPRIFKTEEENEAEATKQYENILAEAIIDPNITIPEPETLLSLHETPILWRGGKSFVCAVAKARKTTALTLFTAILLGKDEAANGFYAMPGCRVLFVDTEQARYDTQKIAERVARLCGKSRKDMENLQVLSLNHFDYRIIKGVIETAIIKFRPDVVMLDNWTDCVKSVLDEADCVSFSQDLRALAETYNLAIFSVIHANESAGEQPKFRGWAIEEARKSDLTLYLKDMSESTDPELQGDYSRARFGKCRGRKPEEFAISLDEEGLPCLYHHEADPTPKPGKDAPILERIPPQGLSYTELCKVIHEVAGIGKTAQQNKVNKLVASGLVVKTEDRRYYLPPTQPQEKELPF